jgi:hypothetical protein
MNMSDPAPSAAPEPVAPAVAPISDPAPAVVTEVDIPDDGGFPDPAPDPATAPDPAAAAPSDPAPAEPKTIKKSPYQGRIDALTAQRTAAERRAEEAERQAALYKAMAEGGGTPPDPNADPATPAKPAVGLVPGSPEFKQAVAEEARQIAAQEQAKARTDGLLSAGNADYKDFTERCNVVASLGAGDRADFMQIVTDPSVIPDGHKVIAELAEKPEEAARILALPTVQMTAALVKFQAEISKAPPLKPLSNAPPPIKPIDGQSHGNDEPSEADSMAEYARKYKAQQEKRLREGTPARFARH